MSPSASPSAAELLRWYDRHRRTLPWRALPGQTANPYHVWLSEIMLQQTTVTAVIPYFERFTHLFPTVRDLARADQDTVMGAWAGLGYYARARNLHACAQMVVRDMDGRFPDTVEGLRTLPGIGPYTAAAIAAIAFARPVVPVDGNVERVTTRLFAMTDPLPRARPAIARQAAHLNDDPLAHDRPSDFAQALFDLGAGICTPRTPACALCPWQGACAGLREGIAATLPRKTPKAPRPTRYGIHFYMTDASDHLLLHRREESGLLGGTLGLPGPQWRAERWSRDEGLRHAPPGRPAPHWRHVGEVKHVFTHFTLIVDVYAAHVTRFTNTIARDGGLVFPVVRLEQMGIASLMRKCIALAQECME